MKVIFVSTTNESAKCIVGQEVELSYERVAHFSFNPEGLGFDYRRGEWRTSRITNISSVETSRFSYLVTVTTGNSEYVFRDGEETEEEPLTDRELAVLSLSMGLF